MLDNRNRKLAGVVTSADADDVWRSLYHENGARDHLPHMYGSARWTLVDDVARLPLKVADIHRRLTA